MARIALTGATGFIGGTVAAVLSARGHDVLCLTRRPVDLPWPSQVVDFADVEDLSRAVADRDAVAHLAIFNDFHGMYADRRAAYDGYVGLTRRILDAANAVGARVGYVSTDWVFDGTGHLVDEDETPNPVNLYGYLKTASELVVLHRASSGFVARVGGVQGLHQTQAAGPRSQDVGFGYFVLALVDALRSGERFTVWEDPAINSVATPIVSAEIGALLGLAFDAGAEGVLHFAGGTAVTRRELAEATCRVFGLDVAQVDFAPPPDSARLPAPVPYDTSMSGARTAALLGTTTWPIEDQLGSLAAELAHGIPVPLS
ncbi:SDR family oxidoreductase [Nostocoides jenkinsii]|uniref:dTDP-4-dehydrorhamnose reductase n=1 Tax=Nostocoides jenkinsii Ben 74 TaxID=1193518 RepID=A0A077M9A7_9MICO|nr:sugar nucleotide-binding protein [Tetrasphaera jenkinsii]CCI53249.1 putative dTDP-4-dehydrorhamnose reductase [Tetrasphaera jenkinsii Ben 74]